MSGEAEPVFVGRTRCGMGAVGRQIDSVGGRQVLCASNIVLAAGLALLGASASVWTMSAAWLLLGIGMGVCTENPIRAC